MTRMNYSRVNARERATRRGTEHAGHEKTDTQISTSDAAAPARSPVALTEPIKIAEFWKNRRGESIRVELRSYEGYDLVDLRQRFTDKEGRSQPSRKGLALVVARLPDLAAAINKALEKAIELGLVEGDE